MWDATCAWPDLLTGALEAARRAFGPPAAQPGKPQRAVVAFGLGPAAAACDATAALVADQLAVPFVVCRDSVVPALVGPDCLVVAVSCGDTPETVAAAHQSLERGARVVGIGNDAELAGLGARSDMPWCEVGAAGPTGRTAFGLATVSLLGALSAEGLLPDWTDDVSAAADFVVRRRDAFSAGIAAELARGIGRTIPLVYGATGIGAVAARWWKSCVNLNAKSPAFAAELPALTYDELAGWGQGGDVTRQTMTLVFLRHSGETPPVSALFDAVRSATEEVMADVLEVRADGDNDLARLLDLALLGELVSLELAAREGVDPGPAPAIEDVAAVRR
jgi:glucose/mannose-6-phosphate isomerase